MFLDVDMTYQLCALSTLLLFSFEVSGVQIEQGDQNNFIKVSGVQINERKKMEN